jgi:hypothetical protein
VRCACTVQCNMQHVACNFNFAARACARLVIVHMCGVQAYHNNNSNRNRGGGGVTATGAERACVHAPSNQTMPINHPPTRRRGSAYDYDAFKQTARRHLASCTCVCCDITSNSSLLVLAFEPRTKRSCTTPMVWIAVTALSG